MLRLWCLQPLRLLHHRLLLRQQRPQHLLLQHPLPQYPLPRHRLLQQQLHQLQPLQQAQPPPMPQTSGMLPCSALCSPCVSWWFVRFHQLRQPWAVVSPWLRKARLVQL